MTIKRTFFLVLAAVSISSAAKAGQFLKSPGAITLGTCHISVSTTNAVDGLVPTIAWTGPQQQMSETMTSSHWKAKAWFVCVEKQTSTTNIWLFDGKDRLSVILVSDKTWADADDSKDIAKCPAEVRKALPPAVREVYFGQGS